MSATTKPGDNWTGWADAQWLHTVGFGPLDEIEGPDDAPVCPLCGGPGWDVGGEG